VADGKSEKRKHIFVVLRVLVVVGGVIAAVVWLSREGRWAELKDIFGRMDMWLVGCVFGIFCLSQVLVAFRWWLLLRTQGIFIRFWAALRLYLLGWFYNNVMPGSVGGDLIRIWYVTKHTEKKFEAGLSVFVDRVIGLLSTFLIAVFFYVVFPKSPIQKEALPEKHDSGWYMQSYGWFFLVPCVVIGAVLIGFAVHRRGRGLLVSLFRNLCRQGVKAFKKLICAGKLYGSRPLVILATFALTVGLQIMVITGFWVLGSNLGIEADLTDYYVVFTLVWVIGAIPVSIGGAVWVEGTLVGLFWTLAGVPSLDATALALCQRFIWLLASLPGALIHLTGTHLPKDFSVDSEGSGQ
jgi:uncharacterized protein (TIRG00374 family)